MKSRFWGVIFPLIVVFVCCISNHQKYKTRYLFYSQRIQDSLEYFIAGLPDMENEYGVPIKVMIHLWKDSTGDTMIMFCAHYQLNAIEPPPAQLSSFEADTTKWIGAAKVATMICPLGLNRIDSIPAFVNKSALTIKRRDFDYFINDSLDLRDLPCSEPIPVKTYLYKSADSLELIYSRDWESKK